MASTIPEKIGRYQVERLLGQGAMGAVFLARDPELDRAVAIKTVRDLDLDEERLLVFLERFRNEAKAAARLGHPAIVAVYDVGEDEGVGPYLVFEYVAGSTLKQIIRSDGAMAAEDVIKLGRRIGAALDTAHAAGVVHRDVKPDNILVAASGDAKLADFGIARLPDAALTKEGQFLGTPCYAAPETLSKGKYGAHSDLFSFAAVLYEVVSGVRAFPGDDAISVAHAVVHDEPVPVARAGRDAGVDVSKEVARVIERGLDKDPDARYRSALEMMDALSAAYIEAGVLDADPTGVQVLPPPITSPTLDEKRRSGTPAFAVAVAILAILGIGFVIAYLDLGAGLTGGGGSDDGDPRIDEALDAGAAEVPLGGDAMAGARDAGVDAGVDDAGADAGEAPADPLGLSGMDTYEREEAAKDEIDRARELIAVGDLDAAREALRRARLYDSGNGDIAELESRLGPAE